jgi:hypothetical protein
MTRAIHTLTGKIDDISDEVLNSKAGKYLKVVADDAKELIAGMFREGTVEEFDEQNPELAAKLESGSKEDEDKDAAPDMIPALPAPAPTTDEVN